MGLHVDIYKNPLGDCTNNGISSRVKGFTITNVEGPFEPCKDYPAAIIRDDKPLGRPYPKIVPTELHNSKKWVMFGGNIANSSDTRFCEAVREADGGPFAALPIFDRVEEYP
jgi:hypothetical protein